MIESSGSCAAISGRPGIQHPDGHQECHDPTGNVHTNRYHEHRSASHPLIPLCSGSSLLTEPTHYFGTGERTRGQNRIRLAGRRFLRC